MLQPLQKKLGSSIHQWFWKHFSSRRGGSVSNENFIQNVLCYNAFCFWIILMKIFPLPIAAIWFCNRVTFLLETSSSILKDKFQTDTEFTHQFICPLVCSPMLIGDKSTRHLTIGTEWNPLSSKIEDE